MEAREQVVFDFATGKEIRTPIDDAWVIENTRNVSLVSDKATISANGDDTANVIVMLTTGWLASVEEKRAIAEDATVMVIADGERYKVALTAGMGMVSVKAVAAGSYTLDVEGVQCEALTITASASVEIAVSAEAQAAVDTQATIVLGVRAKAEAVRDTIGDRLKLLNSEDFDKKETTEQVALLKAAIVDLIQIIRKG